MSLLKVELPTMDRLAKPAVMCARHGGHGVPPTINSP
jgi:hypothetical protein